MKDLIIIIIMIKMKKKQIYKEVLDNLFNTNLNDPPKNILRATIDFEGDFGVVAVW